MTRMRFRPSGLRAWDPNRRAGQGGPPLALLIGISTALFIASLVAGIARAGRPFPSPYLPEATRLEYFTDVGSTWGLAALLQFAAAIPLAIFAASVHARLHQLGVRAPGASIAFSGGLLAAALLALSALLQRALSRAGGGAPDTVLALHDLVFLTGGPGHVVPLGLLVAGIAVPGLLLRLLPRAFAVAGLIIAAVAQLSTLAVLVPGAAYLLPVRFAALGWLLTAAILLPDRRRPHGGVAPRTPTSGTGAPPTRVSTATAPTATQTAAQPGGPQ